MHVYGMYRVLLVCSLLLAARGGRDLGSSTCVAFP